MTHDEIFNRLMCLLNLDREEADWLFDDLGTAAITIIVERIEKAEAERDRYEKALEEIAHPTYEWGISAIGIYQTMQQIARKALEGKP